MTYHQIKNIDYQYESIGLSPLNNTFDLENTFDRNYVKGLRFKHIDEDIKKSAITHQQKSSRYSVTNCRNRKKLVTINLQRI